MLLAFVTEVRSSDAATACAECEVDRLVSMGVMEVIVMLMISTLNDVVLRLDSSMASSSLFVSKKGFVVGVLMSIFPPLVLCTDGGELIGRFA